MTRSGTDILIVGSGLAGLWCALRAARFGRVTVITKTEPQETNTRYAQGGVAAVLSPEDDLASHVRDTLGAGAGLCHPGVVRLVVEAGPPLVRELVGLGVEFTRDSAGGLDLGREGGHSARRIAHAADRTGLAIETALLRAVQAEPDITLLADHFAVDLILASRMSKVAARDEEACWGAYVLGPDGGVRPLMARATLLATGGAGKVYRYTSNPDVATGDGVALAYRAGAPVSNLEFVQFHPTCLYHPRARSFLVTEALRGEGARITARDGERFLAAHDSREELAPRDIVARAIDHEMKSRGDEHVWLDARHLGEAFLLERFPQVMEGCRAVGIDPAREPIPVVPAAHYLCGGVRTGVHGETDIQRLYAAGETAHTGLHGANRLASNSLLEALVFSDRAAAHMEQWMGGDEPPPPDSWVSPTTGHPREEVVINHNWQAVRRLMWDYVGIVRDHERLADAAARMAPIRGEVDRFYRRFAVDRDLLELRNLVLVAGLIRRLAAARHESRGLHFDRDHPGVEDGFRRDSVLSRVGDVSWGLPVGDPGAAA